MAYYAKIVNQKVVNVIKADADFFDTFVDDSPGDWIEAFPDAGGDSDKRYNFCGVEDNYDAVADAFYSAKPYPSWTLNTTTYTWEAPVATPSEKRWWDEENNQWDSLESNS